MSTVEQSVRTQKMKLEAYARARPLLEPMKDNHMFLQCAAEIVWEFLGEQGRFLEIAQLIQDGMNHVALGIQKLEHKAVLESAQVETPRVVVSWNETPRMAACGVCGKPNIELQQGPELFLEGSPEPLCETCAGKYTPELVALMRVFKKNPQFVSVLRDMHSGQPSAEAPSAPIAPPLPPTPPAHRSAEKDFGGF